MDTLIVGKRGRANQYSFGGLKITSSRRARSTQHLNKEFLFFLCLLTALSNPKVASSHLKRLVPSNVNANCVNPVPMPMVPK
jgi:hypothetical protein